LFSPASLRAAGLCRKKHIIIKWLHLNNNAARYYLSKIWLFSLFGGIFGVKNRKFAQKIGKNSRKKSKKLGVCGIICLKRRVHLPEKKYLPGV
jgi:hypothetical protein